MQKGELQSGGGPDSTGLGSALVRCDDVEGGGRDQISQVFNC